MFILRKLYYILIDLVETFVIAGAIFVVIYAFFFRLFVVNGESMIPNFQDGEYIITNLITLKLTPLHRGDVVVFQAPPSLDKDYIKRVVGLPGEKVKIKDGKVYIDGKILNESSYLPFNSKTYQEQFLKENHEITIPNNSYFVLGDNREASSDSRDWGLVALDKIIGKSFVVIWPPKDIKTIKGINYYN